MAGLKPTLRTEAEARAKKAQELHERGYKKAEIAAAMGLSSKGAVKDLLREKGQAAAQK
jgi:predicted transcriptional regulator